MFTKLLGIAVLWFMAMSVYAGYGYNTNPSNNSNTASAGRAILRFDTMYAVNGPFVSHSPVLSRSGMYRVVVCPGS